MINGLMTLSGAWDKIRTDPIIRMMVTAIAFYGMSTFEGPVMSIKAVNSLSHYTDWTIGHVHSGALGWVGMITFGSLYHMLPRLWNTELYSLRLVYVHEWATTVVPVPAGQGWPDPQVRREAVRQPIEQARRKRLLERPETPSDGRLRHFQHAGGRRKVALPHHGEEDPHIVPVERHLGFSIVAGLKIYVQRLCNFG
jgi:hypothetical protein